MLSKLVFDGTYFIFDKDTITLESKKQHCKIYNVSNIKEIKKYLKEFVKSCHNKGYHKLTIDIEGLDIPRKIYLICNNETNTRTISYTDNYKEIFETIFKSGE